MTRLRGLCVGGIAALLLGCAAAACDRRIEPFDPDEKPAQPDLSKIFPAGAARREPLPAELPPAPEAQERAAPPLAQAGAPAAQAGPPIRGTLRLADAVRDRVPPGAVLFLLARSAESGPPLAVVRIPQPSFPLEFEIGPDDRMIQSLPFAGPVSLSARLDADGNASSRQPGDLQGTAPAPVAPGARGVELVIDTVL